jgi:RNA polymerase sigma-70 factor (ECF subfamily)
MIDDSTANEKLLQETALTEKFLTARDDESFAGLFRVFTPQLISFFRTRGCEQAVAEDLAQEVMFTVHRKVGQIRDRTLFRSWLFRIARNAMCRHYGRHARGSETVNLDGVIDRVTAGGNNGGGSPAFEFHQWMGLLDAREREVMSLRFIEQWEYHEIAAEQRIPIGTVQWRVFNAKKKLAPHLAARRGIIRRAA